MLKLRRYLPKKIQSSHLKASRYRPRFQASSGHSDSANRPGYEAAYKKHDKSGFKNSLPIIWIDEKHAWIIRPHYIGSLRMSYMYGIWCVLFFFEKPLVKNTFFKYFPKKTLRLWISRNPDLDFNPKNPPWVWILWIHDPFLDSEIRIWIFP